jgi:purine-cytosine permease-like protein
VQGLFVNQTLLTGPLVHLVGGADISWIVGLVVPGPVYLALCRLRDRAASRALASEPSAAR